MFYQIKDLTKKIQGLKFEKGNSLFVHSALHSFGVPIDINPTDFSYELLESLNNLTGNSGNIIVPTFNFQFAKGKTYDIKNSPSEGMGAFSEFVRKLDLTVRSKHPLQSVCVVGKDAKEICLKDTYSAFGHESAFEKMLSLDTEIILLGASIQAVSFVHLAEEKFNVPYRYWKEFEGNYVDEDKINQKKKYGMFVRNLDLDPNPNLTKIEPILKKNGKIHIERFSYGYIKLFKAVDFIKILNEELDKNVNWLIDK